jgi:hypothetical protein
VKTAWGAARVAVGATLTLFAFAFVLVGFALLALSAIPAAWLILAAAVVVPKETKTRAKQALADL